MGCSLEDAFFTFLAYADNVALTDMLEVLLLSLEIMKNEAMPYRLKISCAKIKIQILDCIAQPRHVSIVKLAGSDVEVVELVCFNWVRNKMHAVLVEKS